jgi:hypothetical protein
MNVQVDVFTGVVGFLVMLVVKKPTTAVNTSTSTFILKTEAATAV